MTFGHTIDWVSVVLKNRFPINDVLCIIVRRSFDFCGGVAERSNAAVLKTVDLQGSGGSNPSLSASARHSRTKYDDGGLFNSTNKY